MRTLKMHALDWLNMRGGILCGAIQPIQVPLYKFSLRRYRLRYPCSVTRS